MSCRCDVPKGKVAVMYTLTNRRLQFTVINVTNQVALYNFLSTFSGTHYVTPRTITGELGFHF